MYPHRILALCALVLSASAHAQTSIERVKMSDNELSCQQLFDESKALDKTIADAKAAQSPTSNSAMAGQAAGVASDVAQRNGIFGSLGSLGGQLLNSVTTRATASVRQETGPQNAAQASKLEKQAEARKDHLSQLFLGKGCSAKNLSQSPVQQGSAGAL